MQGQTASAKSRLDLSVTGVFTRNWNSQSKYVLNQGGARSSKSYSIAQLLCLRFVQCSGRKILVTRKTLPSLRLTAYKLVIDMLTEWGVYQHCEHIKQTRELKYRGNYMAFLSVDEPSKIKSTEWNDVWMEEATEFTYDDFMVLKTRMSGPVGDNLKNQMFLSFNPDEASFLYDRLSTLSDVEIIKSTYLDNPFLSADYTAELEALKTQDEAYYQIYAKGEYARRQGLIYPNWEPVDEMPECEVWYGLDFGWNNPTALVAVGFHDSGRYLDERIYRSRMTNAELMREMDEQIPEEFAPIYADSEDPQRIEEIARYRRKSGLRFNIHAAEKGPGSVRKGIDSVKSQSLFVTRRSENVIKEIRSYKWKEDRDGRALDEPLKFNDHAMDAVRYPIHASAKPRARVRIY